MAYNYSYVKGIYLFKTNDVYYFKNSPIFKAMYKFVRKLNTDKSAAIKNSEE